MRFKIYLIRISIILAVIGAVWALIAAVGRSMSQSGDHIQFKIKHLNNQSDILTDDDLRTIMDRDFNDVMVGKPVHEIDVKAIEERYRKESYLRDVKVFIDSRAVLNIEVEPREAFFRVLHDDGTSYFVDKEGYRFPVSRHYTPRVQVVTGKVPIVKQSLAQNDSSVIHHIFELLSFIKKDELLDALVEEIHVEIGGVIELVPKVGKFRIIYGRHDPLAIADRFENLRIFYEEGMPYEGWNKYSSINIEFKDQVVCSLR
jgi:cell division protein FtsQ